MKKKTFWIFVFCYISYTALYIARLNLSMAAPALKSAGLLTSPQVGLLGSAFSVVYAAGRLFNGSISDRMPPWVMIAVGLLASGGSNLLISLQPPFLEILLLWSVNAFSQSMLWGSMLCVISGSYEPEEAKRKASVIGSSVAVGNIMGILLSAAAINRFGAQWAFAVPGALNVLLGGVGVLLLKNVKPQPAALQHRPVSPLTLLKNWEIRGMLLPAIFHGVMKDNVTLWMAMFFADRYGIALEETAWFMLFIPIMGFVGRSVYPACFHLCGGQEHTVTRYAFLVCAVSAALLCSGRLHPAAAMACLAVIYAAVSAANTSFSSIFPLRFSQSGHIAAVGGLLDFSIYIGAGAASFFYGFLIDAFGYFPLFFSWTAASVLAVFLLQRYERILRRQPQPSR